MENTEIKFTIEDHDSIKGTELHITAIKGIIRYMKDSVNKQITDVDIRLNGHDKDIREIKDYVLTSKTERKVWSVVGGIIGGIAVVVVGGLLLHFLGKI